MLFSSNEEKNFVTQMFANGIFNNIPVANIITLNNILAQAHLIDEAYSKEISPKDKAPKAKEAKVVDMPKAK